MFAQRATKNRLGFKTCQWHSRFKLHVSLSGVCSRGNFTNSASGSVKARLGASQVTKFGKRLRIDPECLQVPSDLLQVISQINGLFIQHIQNTFDHWRAAIKSEGSEHPLIVPRSHTPICVNFNLLTYEHHPCNARLAIFISRSKFKTCRYAVESTAKALIIFWIEHVYIIARKM